MKMQIPARSFEPYLIEKINIIKALAAEIKRRMVAIANITNISSPS
jgi:hypothetical protein